MSEVKFPRKMPQMANVPGEIAPFARSLQKPLGIKSYGSIPHLVSSKVGKGDKRINEGQSRLFTDKCGKTDIVFVTEKLDGSCCAIANVDGAIVALGKSGHPALSSPYLQHHKFAWWVEERADLFEQIILPGERMVGEWLAQAHGTRYDLEGRSPFAVFDIMDGHSRAPFIEVMTRCEIEQVAMVPLVHVGSAMKVEDAWAELGIRGKYGAQEQAEGLVYRIERDGQFLDMAKWVRDDYKPGCLLPEQSGGPEIWNWVDAS